MIAKDSVQKRLSREGSGLSFTEFTYQLIQGHDFNHLNKNFNCRLQIGGSDQYGNATTGLEMIRKSGGDADSCGVLTWPLVTRADGTKFGKSEGGKNIWLDPSLTSPFEFYQFWLNQSDADAEKFIKMFTLLSVDEIQSLIAEHSQAPHLHKLQKKLAFEVTSMVHSVTDAQMAVEASEALFAKDATIDTFKKFDENTLLTIFNGVPHLSFDKKILEQNPTFVDFAVASSFSESKAAARRDIKNGAFSKNKSKINDANSIVSANDLLHDKYIILQKGKKYSLAIAQ
jgi:tyrosyl-tRNA synthetase